jgi:hypothetical protein
MRLWALLLVAATTFKLAAQTTDPWKKLDFLFGEWTGIAGEKDTQLGTGQGDFLFQPQLNRKITCARTMPATIPAFSPTT